MLDVKLYQAQAYLPLPYEAVLAPRLKRAGEKIQAAGGWARLPEERASLAGRIRAAADRIRARSQVLAVLGGGPGPQGLADCLCPPFRDLRQQSPGLVFLDGGARETAVRSLGALLEGKDFFLAVMPSQGGDPFLLRLLRPLCQLLEERYGPEGAQRRLLRFDGPDGLPPGGWDLLGEAALLPAAVAGADVEALLAGAAEMMERCRGASFENPAWRYAAIRHQLYRSGRTVEVLASFDGSLRRLLEWRQGLAAGGEGREGKGLFPAWAVYPRDLSTMGQAVGEGRQRVLETVLCLGGADRLREEALEFLLLARGERGVPSVVLRTGGGTAAEIGGLVYFFQYACALSCGLLDVDPFSRTLVPPDRDGEGEMSRPACLAGTR